MTSWWMRDIIFKKRPRRSGSLPRTAGRICLVVQTAPCAAEVVSHSCLTSSSSWLTSGVQSALLSPSLTSLRSSLMICCCSKTTFCSSSMRLIRRFCSLFGAKQLIANSDVRSPAVLSICFSIASYRSWPLVTLITTDPGISIWARKNACRRQEVSSEFLTIMGPSVICSDPLRSSMIEVPTGSPDIGPSTLSAHSCKRGLCRVLARLTTKSRAELAVLAVALDLGRLGGGITRAGWDETYGFAGRLGGSSAALVFASGPLASARSLVPPVPTPDSAGLAAISLCTSWAVAGDARPAVCLLCDKPSQMPPLTNPPTAAARTQGGRGGRLPVFLGRNVSSPFRSVSVFFVGGRLPGGPTMVSVVLPREARNSRSEGKRSAGLLLRARCTALLIWGCGNGSALS